MANGDAKALHEATRALRQARKRRPGLLMIPSWAVALVMRRGLDKSQRN